MRGVGAELDSGLISGLAEVREEGANLFFAGVDDLAGGRRVNRDSDILTQLLEAAAQLVQRLMRFQERLLDDAGVVQLALEPPVNLEPGQQPQIVPKPFEVGCLPFSLFCHEKSLSEEA